MFDLEKAIADWRKQMLAAGIRAPVPLEELENHLREEIEQRAKSGLNAQQAFEIAVEGIGQTRVLKAEFKKVGGAIQIPLRPAVFAFSSLAFFVTTLFVPLFFGVGYLCVVTVSVWEISKIITFVCAVLISTIVLLPIFRQNAKSWIFPFLFGLTVLVSTVCATVYTFSGLADRIHINLYFHPSGLILLAIGASLCIAEGLMVKSRRHFSVPPAS